MYDKMISLFIIVVHELFFPSIPIHFSPIQS